MIDSRLRLFALLLYLLASPSPGLVGAYRPAQSVQGATRLPMYPTGTVSAVPNVSQVVARTDDLTSGDSRRQNEINRAELLPRGGSSGSTGSGLTSGSASSSSSGDGTGSSGLSNDGGPSGTELLTSGEPDAGTTGGGSTSGASSDPLGIGGTGLAKSKTAASSGGSGPGSSSGAGADGGGTADTTGTGGTSAGGRQNTCLDSTFDSADNSCASSGGSGSGRGAAAGTGGTGSDVTVIPSTASGETGSEPTGGVADGGGAEAGDPSASGSDSGTDALSGPGVPGSAGGSSGSTGSTGSPPSGSSGSQEPGPSSGHDYTSTSTSSSTLNSSASGKSFTSSPSFTLLHSLLTLAADSSCASPGSGCAVLTLALPSVVSEPEACSNELTLAAQVCAQCVASQEGVGAYNRYLAGCVAEGLSKPSGTVGVGVGEGAKGQPQKTGAASGIAGGGVHHNGTQMSATNATSPTRTGGVVTDAPAATDGSGSSDLPSTAVSADAFFSSSAAAASPSGGTINQGQAPVDGSGVPDSASSGPVRPSGGEGNAASASRTANGQNSAPTDESSSGSSTPDGSTGNASPGAQQSQSSLVGTESGGGAAGNGSTCQNVTGWPNANQTKGADGGGVYLNCDTGENGAQGGGGSPTGAAGQNGGTSAASGSGSGSASSPMSASGSAMDHKTTSNPAAATGAPTQPGNSGGPVKLGTNGTDNPNGPALVAAGNATAGLNSSTTALAAIAKFFQNSSSFFECMGECATWQNSTMNCTDDSCACSNETVSAGNSCFTCLSSNGMNISTLEPAYATFTETCQAEINATQAHSGDSLLGADGGTATVDQYVTVQNKGASPSSDPSASGASSGGPTQISTGHSLFARDERAVSGRRALVLLVVWGSWMLW